MDILVGTEAVSGATMNVEANDPISDDEKITSKEEEQGDCPVTCLTNEEKARLRNPWKHMLILKVWGRTINYNYLLDRLRAIWHPSAGIDLIAIENDYYLAKFTSMDDYKFAKFEGPLMILDHYLIVKSWTLNFDPYADTTEKVLVWVRFPYLPIEYFDVNDEGGQQDWNTNQSG